MTRRNLVGARILLLSAALLTCVAAYSAAAPWYRWRNRVDRTILCAQNSPGDVWEKFQGPYQDSRCRKEGSPQ